MSKSTSLERLLVEDGLSEELKTLGIGSFDPTGGAPKKWRELCSAAGQELKVIAPRPGRLLMLGAEFALNASSAPSAAAYVPNHPRLSEALLAVFYVNTLRSTLRKWAVSNPFVNKPNPNALGSIPALSGKNQMLFILQSAAAECRKDLPKTSYLMSYAAQAFVNRDVTKLAGDNQQVNTGVAGTSLVAKLTDSQGLGAGIPDIANLIVPSTSNFWRVSVTQKALNGSNAYLLFNGVQWYGYPINASSVNYQVTAPFVAGPNPGVVEVYFGLNYYRPFTVTIV